MSAAEEGAGRPADRRIGSRIGHIRLERLIGEGGMGSVFEGWDEKLERRVAVKAVSPAYRLDQQSRGRFLSEARILSKLHHPNICQIYELLEQDESDAVGPDAVGGDAVGGDHLVLELVEGRHLREVMREEEIDASRAMDVARQLVAAVAVAHEKGIVHRDLKPANVMITDDGTVKVLDFGLALSVRKRVERGSARAGLEWTESGQVARPSPRTLSEEGPLSEDALSEGLSEGLSEDLSEDRVDADQTLVSGGAGSGSAIEGTLAYMSPEQARGEPAMPGSDIYSLGILLHELFCGASAYEENLSLPAQLVRVGNGETRPVEGVDPDLARLIERMKSRAPGARPSAADVAERLRWIATKPRRRARRAAIGAFVVLVTIFAAVMAYQRSRIAEEAERAEREAVAARQVSDFLVELFEVSDPWSEESGDVSVREILERGTRRIRGELEGQPATRARLLGTMGEVYRGLGLYERARPLLEESVELRREVGADPTELADGLGDLAQLESDLGRYEEAETLFRRAMELRREALGETKAARDPRQADLLHLLGFLHYRKGDYEEAISIYREALERRREIFGEESLQVAESLGDIALAHDDLGNQEEAGDLHRRALEIRRQILPEGHPLLGLSYANLAAHHYRRGEYERTVPLFERDLEIARESLGPDHPDVAISHNNLAAVLRELGRFEEAVPHALRSLEIRRSVLGEEHAATGVGHHTLGGLYRQLGKMEPARRHFDRALGIWRESLGEDHPNVGAAHKELARLEQEGGRLRVALEHALRAAEIRRDHFGADHVLTLEALHEASGIELELGNAEAARIGAEGILDTLQLRIAENPEDERLLELLESVRSLLENAAED